MTSVFADDADEGDNAVLRYSLQENAVDAKSGQPVFEVDELTGFISTALCCLDREKTNEYKLTLVVRDGGGLKGEGEGITVAIYDAINILCHQWKP